METDPSSTSITHAVKFNGEVGKLLNPQDSVGVAKEEEYEKSTEDMYMTWTTAITKAAKTTLPVRKQASLPLRDVSACTRRLFDVKANMRKCKHTTQEYSAIQDKIRESSLQDFRDWVRRNVEDMERANDRGDVKRIYRTEFRLKHLNTRRPLKTHSLI